MIFLNLEAPFEWVDAKGSRVEAFGEVPDSSNYPITEEEVVVGVVPGEWVTSHRIKIPAKTRKQFNAALPYALEELFAEDIEHLYFVCPKWQAETEVTVYSVAKSKLHEWSQICSLNSIPATRIIPDYALLPTHDVASCTLALVGERVLARSEYGFGVSMDVDLVPLWLKETSLGAVIAVNDKAFAEKLVAAHSERDIRYWSFGDRMAHWLEYSGLADIDLWSEQYRPRSRKARFKEYLPAVAVAGVAVLALAISAVISYYSLHREIASITTESQVLVKQLLPELDYVAPGQERMFAERILSERGHGSNLTSLPRMLMAIAPAFRAERVTLKEIRYAEEQLIVSAYLSSLGQVDGIVNRLRKLVAFDVKLQGTSTEDNAIVATFVLASTDLTANQ